VAVVWVLWSFAHPALSWFMAPMIERVLGPAGLHYPELFRRLPTLVGRADAVIAASVAAVVIGASTRLFAECFLGRAADAGAALREMLRRAPALILAQLPFHALAWGLGAAVSALLGGTHHGGLVRVLALALAVGGALLIQALGLFVTALVVLEGRTPLEAWRALPRTWAHGLWAALLLSGLLALAQSPFQWIESHASTLVDRGTPEVVGLVVLLQGLAMLLAALVVTGCVTLVFLAAIHRTQDQEAL